jgi:RHS repeat-associated protein
MICTGTHRTVSFVCRISARFSPTRFTGKERDAESGNDYFEARYYASSMGRFLSPDPLYLELHRLTDPQQLNIYA